MEFPTHTLLRDTAIHLSTFAGVMQIPGREQRAQSIRKAEKALVGLEAFFTNERAQSVRKWKDAAAALDVLYSKMKKIDSIQKQMDICESKISVARSSMEKWLHLPEHDRHRFLQEARNGRSFIENEIFQSEAHILHRYQRYSALRVLDPFADNADHLCEAIHHYENRQKYESNLAKLEQRKEQAQERLKSVRRGFLFAMSFCALAVTIPLCAPIAFSLWTRRRDIETQIANFDETKRREQRRIQAAEEGVVASDTIREILGEVPLDQIRRTLAELRELRAEFNHPEKSSSLTTRMLTFLDLNQIALSSLFGETPSDPVEAVSWFVRNVTLAQNMENHISEEENALSRLAQKQRALTKGYSPAILKRSIMKLEEVRVSEFQTPFADDFKSVFGDLCERMPPLLNEARGLLWRITHAQMVPDSIWYALQIRIRSEANIFDACLTTLEFDNETPSSEDDAVAILA
jgi:hypothetical protein